MDGRSIEGSLPSLTIRSVKPLALPCCHPSAATAFESGQTAQSQQSEMFCKNLLCPRWLCSVLLTRRSSKTDTDISTRPRELNRGLANPSPVSPGLRVTNSAWLRHTRVGERGRFTLSFLRRPTLAISLFATRRRFRISVQNKDHKKDDGYVSWITCGYRETTSLRVSTLRRGRYPATELTLIRLRFRFQR